MPDNARRHIPSLPASPRILVLVPTYNEAENIRRLVELIRRIPTPLDILVVDDHSPDGTARTVEEIRKSDSLLFLLTRAERGYAGALKAGFNWALARSYYDVVITMDADGSHDPAAITHIVEALKKNDVSIGSRYHAGGAIKNWAWWRRWLSRSGNFYARTLLKLPIADLTTGYVGYRTRVLQTIQFEHIHSEGYVFLIQMKREAYQAQFRIQEVPIVFTERREGASKLSGAIIVEAIKLPFERYRTRDRWMLGIISLIALFMRGYGLSAADIITDEALYGFRAIGYLDFMASPHQTTPLEWTDQPLWWTKLSFHDHPPLFLAVEYIAIKILGDTAFALRLPSLIFGLATIWLVYRIGSALFSRLHGLVAALLLATVSAHIWISRTGLQESLLVFLIATSVYCFVRASRSYRYYLLTGIVWGLALLTKYTAIVLVPVFAGVVLLFRREVLRRWYPYGALFITGLILTPIIAYNIFLYRTFGHFDLQLSFLLSQEPSHWESLPGKEQIGTFATRVHTMVPHYLGMYSVLFLGTAFAGMLTLVVHAIKSRPHHLRESQVLVLLIIVMHLALPLAVGNAGRFLAMSSPWLSLAIAYGAVFSLHRAGRYGIALTTFVVVFELFFSYTSLFAREAPGSPPYLSAKAITDASTRSGYHTLDGYLSRELSRTYPALTFPARYPFLEEIKASAVRRAREKTYAPRPLLIVYDANVHDLAALWVFVRRSVYQGWPIITADAYRSTEAHEGADYFWKAGIKEVLFVRPGNLPVLRPATERVSTGKDLETIFGARGKLFAIRNESGETVFRAYLLTAPKP